MTLGYREPLHGRELVGARCVGDLQRADVLVAAYHLQNNNLGVTTYNVATTVHNIVFVKRAKNVTNCRYFSKLT